ncbi:MAG: hypothetical protein H6861_06955 [Rhodospirillales bacterium]|nr:hypothetical protein [Rhodospirillales bacterium]
MSAEIFDTKLAGRRKPKNVLAGAIDIAIRDAEIHGTDLIIKTDGKVRHVSPQAMKKRLAKS